jgi:hypothetical protein
MHFGLQSCVLVSAGHLCALPVALALARDLGSRQPPAQRLQGFFTGCIHHCTPD